MNFNIFSRSARSAQTCDPKDGMCDNRHHHGVLADRHIGDYFLCGSCRVGSVGVHKCISKCILENEEPNRLACPNGYRIKVEVPNIYFPDGNDTIGFQPQGVVEGYVHNLGCCAISDDDPCIWSNDFPSSNNPGGGFGDYNSTNPFKRNMSYIGYYTVGFSLRNFVTGVTTNVNKMGVFAWIAERFAWHGQNTPGRRTHCGIVLSPLLESYGKFTHMDLGIGAGGDAWAFDGYSETSPGCGCPSNCVTINMPTSSGLGPVTNWVIPADHHSRVDPSDASNAYYELNLSEGSIDSATLTIIGSNEEGTCESGPPPPGELCDINLKDSSIPVPL